MNGLIDLLVFMPMAAALLSYLLGRKTKAGRNAFVGAVVVLEFLFGLLLAVKGQGTESVLPGICGMGLRFTVDGFRAVYVVIAAFMWMVTGLFSPDYFAHYRNRNRYYLFQLVTLGATEGIFLSADLYTTFVFFEIMSLASYVWVAQDEKEEALKAASTYLAVAVIGGLVMLMGRFLLYHQTGTLMIEALPAACAGLYVYAAEACLFVGFGAKAGAFPLHIWLPKAHPVAPAPASSLLSGILTKTGIFGILVISCKLLVRDEAWGTFTLLIGVVTMFLGAALALFSVDFKRTLACSSVSQIGFILVGVGMIGLLGEENLLAVRGTFLHMVNHSVFKLVLFLVAGVIYRNTHKLELNQIRGFGRKKPLLMAIYLMGALGIGGIPGWSGYVSKTLLHESIVEYLEAGVAASRFFTAGSMRGIEWVFLISGGLTVAYMCKLFAAVFLEKNEDAAVQKAYDENKSYMKPLSAGVLALSAVIIPVLGLLPYFTMDRLADLAQGFMGAAHEGHQVHYFTWTNLKGGLISIAIGAAVYVVVARGWMMKKRANETRYYVNRWPGKLDLEERLYRPLLLKVLPGIFGRLCAVLDNMADVAVRVLKAVASFLAGVLDVAVDGVVVLLRKTIYADSPNRGELEEGNQMTHVLGVFLNRLEQLLNKTIWRNHQHKRDFEHWFVLKYAAFKENTTVIGRSLSYGLVLFCIGLCATLVYLLVSSLL